MWRLPGTAHSARSSVFRISRTVTGSCAASSDRSSSIEIAGGDATVVMADGAFMRLSSEDEDVARLGTAASEVRRRAESGLLPLEIGLRDPTGLRAAPSYEDGNAFVPCFRHQLAQRRH